MRKILLLSLFIQFSVQSQNILFVGNSLTYTNNMPDILEYLGKQNGVSIKTKSLCFPNYAIIDHINKGIFQEKLANKKYDYVIIQQGPSSQSEGKRMLIEDGAKIKMICAKYKTKLGYFMVWPSIRYYHTFNKVIENHKAAAKKNKATLFSIGEKWKTYNRNEKLQSVYSSDNFHPSKVGSFLAALTIFHQLHPTKNIEKLPHKNYKKWVDDKESFKKIIQIINMN